MIAGNCFAWNPGQGFGNVLGLLLYGSEPPGQMRHVQYEVIDKQLATSVSIGFAFSRCPFDPLQPRAAPPESTPTPTIQSPEVNK